MRLAERYEVPRSVLLGRPLPGPGETLWTDEDLDWAIAYEAYKATLCPQCGTDHSLWAADSDAFVAIPTRCPGRQAIALAEKEIPEEERNQGAYAALIPGDEYDRREEIKDAAARLGLKRPKLRWVQ